MMQPVQLLRPWGELRIRVSQIVEEAKVVVGAQVSGDAVPSLRFDRPSRGRSERRV